MDQGRAFALAGQLREFQDHVCGNAHSTANAMADGPHKAKVKRLIGEAREALTQHQALVFAVYPAAMTYRPDMPEAELREWAASLMASLP
jgi:hypothetical protein